ncbi:hypothetical protein [Nocardioides sp.]|uniref:hypothetical protein n=1 Tax=Nocardioides sp. TaxID=35761 RepID=UPI00321B0A77
MNGSIRLAVRLALFVALASLALGLAASPSHADDSAERDRAALQLSLDGVTWTESIRQPLFDPDTRWVPGDTRTARFFVRNAKPDSGDLRVVLERPTREALLDTGFLSLAARAGNGPWTEVESGGRHELIDGAAVESQEEEVVLLRASLAADAPNGTMVLASDLDLTLTLTQEGIVDDATSEDDDGGNGNGGNGNGGDSGGSPGSPGSPGSTGSTEGTASGDLPDTGSPLRPWVLPLALLLLASGAVLIVRRGDDEDDQAPAPPQEALTRP